MDLMDNPPEAMDKAWKTCVQYVDNENHIDTHIAHRFTTPYHTVPKQRIIHKLHKGGYLRLYIMLH